MKNCIRAAVMILLSASIAAPAIAQSAGAAVYKEKCQMCHGPDGTAATPMGKMMKIPSFKSPAARKKTEAQYIAITENGMGRMPAYKGKLSAMQIKEVVSYIRTLQN